GGACPHAPQPHRGAGRGRGHRTDPPPPRRLLWHPAVAGAPPAPPPGLGRPTGPRRGSPGRPRSLRGGGGAGAPLALSAARGAPCRWLPFQERLAKSFNVYSPSHPGHGGSPAAEWIEHISDLAFHYLDVLDTLDLERPHLVGASFGGWIAAEIATMASHRLQSLVLIDPVGIRVDDWIYPFLFGMDISELVSTVFHNPMAALALASPDQSIDTLALQYRQGAALARVAWNPHLYNPLLRRRLARISTPTLLSWGAHDRIAPLVPCGPTWAPRTPGARLSVFDESGHAPHLEEPEAVAEAIAEFCRAVEG